VPTTPTRRNSTSRQATSRPPRKATATTTAAAKKATPATKAVPDASSVLTHDHREVDALFRRFEGTGPRAHKVRADL
jgi:hypothetical protein